MAIRNRLFGNKIPDPQNFQRSGAQVRPSTSNNRDVRIDFIRPRLQIFKAPLYGPAVGSY
jgi:hypothetical protein